MRNDAERGRRTKELVNEIKHVTVNYSTREEKYIDLRINVLCNIKKIVIGLWSKSNKINCLKFNNGCE